MRREALRSLGLSWVLVTSACDRSAPTREDDEHALHGEHAHRDEPEHAGLPTRVRLRPEVAQAARIETAKVAREALAITISLPGEIAADPDRSARVSSPIAGRIDRVHFREGSDVKKGDLLAVVRVPDLGRLRATLASTQARARAAHAGVARLAHLAEQRLTSEQSYLDAVAESEALDLEVRAASEQIGALGIAARQGASELALRAPFSGVVLSRNALIGQPIGADEVIAEIADLSELWFLGRVFEKDLGVIATGAAAEVELNAYPRERFSGVVEYIGQKVDPVARTLTARVRVTNRSELLRVGLFGAAHVSIARPGESRDALVVPRSAIGEIAGKPSVFVLQPDGDFELHALTLGASAEGKVEVIAGLREGENVVVSGVFTLKSAVLKPTFSEQE